MTDLQADFDLLDQLHAKASDASKAWNAEAARIASRDGIALIKGAMTPDSVRTDPAYVLAMNAYRRADNVAKAHASRMIKAHGRKAFNDESRRRIDAKRKEALSNG